MSADTQVHSGPVLRLLAWTALLSALLGALHALGGGGLGSPPLLHPMLWGPWATERGAIPVAFSLMRAAAELACAYLLLTTTAGVVTRLAGAAGTAQVLDRLCLPMVRRMLGAVASASLATALSAGTMQRAEGAAPAAPSAVSATAPGNWSVPLMRVAGAPTAPRQPAAPQPPAAPRPRATWTVSPGDNLWVIAERTLSDRLDRAPTDAEVDLYWRRLIAANRARLTNPSMPELIFAGQVFVLPPV